MLVEIKDKAMEVALETHLAADRQTEEEQLKQSDCV